MYKAKSLVLFLLLLGCHSFEDNLELQSLPVGDGSSGGSSGSMSSSSCTFTFTDLKNAITGASRGQTINLPANCVIKMEQTIEITTPGITISGGGSRFGALGAILTTQLLTLEHFFIVKADSVTFTGIKFDGAQQPDINNTTGLLRTGIQIDGPKRLLVENCELQKFWGSAIRINNSEGSQIRNSRIQHNMRSGAGYGIEIGGGSTPTIVLVDANEFYHNRHDVTGAGYANTGFEATNNLIKKSDDSFGNFDMHGVAKPVSDPCNPWAGGSISIHHNTFENDYMPIQLRGKPYESARIYNNTFVTPPIYTLKQLCEEERTCNLESECLCSGNIVMSGNTFLASAPGDNKQDIILLTDDGRLIKHNVNGEQFRTVDPEVVGHGLISATYTKVLSGRWDKTTTNGSLMAITTAGNVFHYPYLNGNFYTGQGTQVGQGFNYENYLVGNWSEDQISDIIARTPTGVLHYYPYTGSFATPIVVGHGFTSLTYKNYFVGNWTRTNGSPDLIVRKSNGELWLIPFLEEKRSFYGGVSKRVGTEFFEEQYFSGNWIGDNKSELLTLNAGIVRMFQMVSDGAGGWTFDGLGIRLNDTALPSYEKYFLADVAGGPEPDLITVDSRGAYWLYQYKDGKLFPVPFRMRAACGIKDHFVNQWE
jgi:hypothetical protein